MLISNVFVYFFFTNSTQQATRFPIRVPHLVNTKQERAGKFFSPKLSKNVSLILNCCESYVARNDDKCGCHFFPEILKHLIYIENTQVIHNSLIACAQQDRVLSVYRTLSNLSQFSIKLAQIIQPATVHCSGQRSFPTLTRLVPW